MNKLVDDLKDNAIFWSKIKKMVLFFDRKERKYEQFLKKIEKIDSIENYDCFKENIQEMLSFNVVQASRRNGTEGQLYGHYEALIKYANLRKYKIPLIPAMEHGIRFTSLKWNYESTFLCYACQGKNRINEIHEIDPWKPVFSLGPYIHYADGYYADDDFLREKNKIGKSLLVFPGHTFEGSTIKRKKDFVELIYKKYSQFFDNIMVCVYWHDVNDMIMKEFEEKGAKLVSAGFRGDINFIRRLKTIIQLADAVVVDGLGTNIGYCIYMGKTVYMEDNGITLPNDKYYSDNYSRFKDAFYSDSLDFIAKQKRLQTLLYEEFWGGKTCIKTVDEIRIIFELLEEIYHLAHYNVKKLPRIISKKMDEWKYDGGEFNNIKYNILREAIML